MLTWLLTGSIVKLNICPGTTLLSLSLTIKMNCRYKGLGPISSIGGTYAILWWFICSWVKFLIDVKLEFFLSKTSSDRRIIFPGSNRNKWNLIICLQLTM